MTGSLIRFKAACVQFCASRSLDQNLETVHRLIGDAVAGGADLVLTPEMTGVIEMDSKVLMANARPEADDPGLAALTAMAEEYGVWLSVGSLVIKSDDGRLANRSFLMSPAGQVVARCDKMHMFDVALPDGETYRESKRYAAGDRAVLADLPWGRIGLSVCYDLRFPALYRALAQAGAAFLSIPSAFTRPTGKAHWHVLLRARAIETGCFVFAAAQDGEHEAGRKTYGHSLIVNPWGEVIADAGIGEGVVFADIDPAEVASARQRIPALEHDRGFIAPETASVRKLAS